MVLFKRAGFFVLFLLTLMVPVGQAQEAKWTHYGVRPLGMGNAYVAIADDYNALFYNPAGLARLKEWDGELINPAVEWSSGSLALLNKASKLASGSSSDVTEALNLLEDEAGNRHHLALGLTPHLIFRGFGFGFGLEVAANFDFHRYPSVYLDAGPRVILPVALAFNALEDRLSIGFALKYVMKAGVNHEFSIQDVEAFTSKNEDTTGPKLDDFVEGGSGLGADFGMLFTPIKTMEPTLGLSISDFGGTPYSKMNISGQAAAAPEARLPSVNMGVSVKPYQTANSYISTAIDVHSMNQPFSFSKKFHIGVEYGLGSIIKLQTGLHQGYLTAGFQFDVGLLNLRYATYSEELGVQAGKASVDNRRHVVQLKLLI